MNKISVIVPCYNASKTLNRCVDSIIKAKTDEFEIILVNDGSKDDTLKICKKYQKQYPDLIKIVDKKNGGLSSARNSGIEIASGDYISFIDSDDSIESNLYKDFLEKNKNFDIVVFGENRIYKDHTSITNVGIKKDCLNKEEIKKIVPFLYPAACNKIYIKELFNKLKFKENVWYEDVDFTYKLLPLLNNIGYIDKNYYNYYQLEGSITYTYNDKLYDLIDNLNSVIEYYKKNNYYNEYYSELEFFYVRYSYGTFIKRLSKMKNKKEFKKGIEIVIDNVKKEFPNYKKNIYFKGLKGLYFKFFNKGLANIIYLVEKNKNN